MEPLIVQQTADPRLSLFGPKALELFRRYNSTAMTYANLQSNGGALPAEHARQFINEMVGLGVGPDYADFLAQVDFDTCGPTGSILDSWELDDVGDIRKHTEKTAVTHEAGETTDERTITPVWIDLYATLSYERVGRWVRRAPGEGAETKSGVSLVLNALRNKMRNEFQNLCINGDDDSTSAHLTIFDGWKKIILEQGADARKNGTAWAATPDVKSMLNRQFLAATQIRHGKILELPGFGYVMSKYCHAVLQEQLQANTSEKGHSQYLVDPKTGVPMWRGLPFYQPSYWPNDLIVMTAPKNFAARITDEISQDMPLMEYDKDIKAGVHEFVMRIPGGCDMVQLDIALSEYDTNNADYVAWVAA